MDFIHSLWFQKLVKFGIVGLCGMCIDFFLTWLCKEKFKWNKYIANSIGFSAAVINNFFLNYVWTFKGTANSIPTALSLFVLFSIIGLLLNNLLIYIFNDVFAINFYISKALAIACVFVWNFTSNYFFNFHP